MRNSEHAPSLPGLTRQSIFFARIFRSGMDARVKPEHDELRERDEKENAYSLTAFSEICHSLPSKIEMCSVFIGE